VSKANPLVANQATRRAVERDDLSSVLAKAEACDHRLSCLERNGDRPAPVALVFSGGLRVAEVSSLLEKGHEQASIQHRRKRLEPAEAVDCRLLSPTLGQAHERLPGRDGFQVQQPPQ
jgi:hypothetical protein